MSTIILLTVVEVRKVLEAKFPGWRGTANWFIRASKVEQHWQGRRDIARPAKPRNIIGKQKPRQSMLS